MATDHHPRRTGGPSSRSEAKRSEKAVSAGKAKMTLSLFTEDMVLHTKSQKIYKQLVKENQLI